IRCPSTVIVPLDSCHLRCCLVATPRPILRSRGSRPSVETSRLSVVGSISWTRSSHAKTGNLFLGRLPSVSTSISEPTRNARTWR
ncbi:hypothetical protein PMAYCL1PPCAC_22407, partial [Pristionchus mayeri]